MRCKCGDGDMLPFDETPERVVLRCEECGFTINQYKEELREIIEI